MAFHTVCGIEKREDWISEIYFSHPVAAVTGVRGVRRLDPKPTAFITDGENDPVPTSISALRSVVREERLCGLDIPFAHRLGRLQLYIQMTYLGIACLRFDSGFQLGGL
jgi:hypothetical protein